MAAVAMPRARRSTPRALALLAAVLGPAGCARHAASQATTGALESFRKGVEQGAPPGQRPAEIVAGRAVDGAIARLQSPEHVASLRMVAGAAAAAAVENALLAAMRPAVTGGRSPVDRLSAEVAGSFRLALAQGLEQDLGNTGPLSESLGGTAYVAAAEATDGAVSRLFPGCNQEDATCLDRRIAALSEQAAVGFGNGLKASLGIPALVLSFLGGGVAALVLLLAVRETRRRAPQPAHRPARA